MKKAKSKANKSTSGKRSDLVADYNAIMKNSITPSTNGPGLDGTFEKFSLYKDYQTVASPNATL